jgi:hypothetical protein
MLNETLVDEIRRLLAAGQWSNRQITRLLGVSRNTVDNIANGRRPDHTATRAARSKCDRQPDSLPERCPTCGGKVFLPCRLCRVRRWQTVLQGVRRDLPRRAG